MGPTQFSDDDIADTAKIWHYTSLLAFLSILQKKQLWFTRLSDLSDPLEGRSEPIFHSRFTLRRESYIRVGCCHCWCVDEHESDLMWARPGIGAAIESAKGRLRRCFAKPYAARIVLGTVAYGKQRQSQLLPKGAFHKHLRFHTEQEYRASLLSG